ncbi:hypothetical protein VTK26DRAFT_9366 [Humicola hyalothermophila]
MGCCSSKPRRLRIRVLLPSKPRPGDADALRDRISLNEATLRATLISLGRLPSPRPPNSRPSTSSASGATTARCSSSSSSTCSQVTIDSRRLYTRRTSAAARAIPSGRNKPLPPLPPLTVGCAVARGSISSSSSSSSSREAEAHHRARALRILESRAGSPRSVAPRQRVGKRSRVPSIILRRVGKGV